MSSKNIIAGLILLAPLLAGLCSCAKKKAPDTPFTLIQGTWKLAQTAADDNANGSIEDAEKHAVSITQDYQITFDDDKTGVEINVHSGDTSIPLYFHWELSKDSLRCAYMLHDTISYYIVNLSSGNLTLQNNTPYGLAWHSYNKK